MVEIGLMVEGQNGLNWPRWQKLLALAEELGFAFVFRSDHFTNASPPDKDSLELWTSLTYAASHTDRIEFGPLVSPVTFRHPSITARVAASVDDLSGGRLVLGIGAGWQDREHRNFGIPFPPASVRFEMLNEYLEIVSRLFRNDQPFRYQGQHYSLEEGILLPRPTRPDGPTILVGGNGRQRTLPLAARYANEWNAVFAGPRQLEELELHLDRLLQQAGRVPDAVRRSVMIGTFLARSSRELRDRLESKDTTVEGSLESGVLVGTADAWAQQLQRYGAVGVQRVMLQWLDLDDLDGLRLVAREVLPAFARA
jgi:F420-dependent oxidoreductase-like protein